MKTIKKTDEHPSLSEGRDRGWNWNEFRTNDNEGYLAVKRQALEDQLNECAYTGLWLGEGSSQTVHLDHFRKKSIYGNLTLVYSNLFAAAKDLPYGSDYKDKIINGPIENADAQYDSFWSPLYENFSNIFWYRHDGVMEPMENLSVEEKNKAQQTIDMYNLNHPDLVRRRLELIHTIEGLKDCDDETIRMCLGPSGFSFVVDFELSKIRIDNV